MLPFDRPDEPTFLKENWQKWGDAYVDRRANDGGARFQWPQVNHQKINHSLSKLLSSASQGHCSYCDFHPLGTWENSIDHFRPKSIPEFYLLVCKWENLYFSCPNCQGFKKEKWSDAPRLIAPDEEGFSFERFFIIDYSTWLIEPNPKATESDKLRAEYTIVTLGLRDSKHVKGRKSNWELYDLKSRVGERYVIDDFAYRYMLA